MVQPELSALLVEDDDAGGNAGAVKQIGGETDDPLDQPPLDQLPANVCLSVPPEKHAMGEDDGSLAGALQRLDDVEQEGSNSKPLGRPHLWLNQAVLPENGIRPYLKFSPQIVLNCSNGWRQAVQ